MWTQIAGEFGGYGERLIFAGMNEVSGDLHGHDLSGSQGAEQTAVLNYCLENINTLNSLFVNTVRAAGGYNAQRVLAVQTYYTIAYAPAVLNGFEMPPDISGGRLIAEVHSYAPWDFVGESGGTPPSWVDEPNIYNDTADQTAWAFSALQPLTDRGIDFFIGEWGTCSVSGAPQAVADRTADRILHAQYYRALAAGLGIPCIVWDNGAADEYGLFDRTTLTQYHGGLADALT
jgi:endoglucanase